MLCTRRSKAVTRRSHPCSWREAIEFSQDVYLPAIARGKNSDIETEESDEDPVDQHDVNSSKKFSLSETSSIASSQDEDGPETLNPDIQRPDLGLTDYPTTVNNQTQQKPATSRLQLSQPPSYYSEDYLKNRLCRTDKS